MDCRKDTKIINKLGLHARAAAKLVELASTFKASVYLVKKVPVEQIADCKSIISVMMLAAGEGTQLEIRTQGPDAGPALEAICKLINNRFEETH